jgi:hypothetical protein
MKISTLTQDCNLMASLKQTSQGSLNSVLILLTLAIAIIFRVKAMCQNAVRLHILPVRGRPRPQGSVGGKLALMTTLK